MAKASGAGESASMGKAELKQALKYARDEPIQAAFALDGGGKAVLQLSRRINARKLEKQIKDDAPDSKNHRWGTASVNPDEPKTIIFTVNKSGGGAARKLIAALKGTGFNKVRLRMEDGTELESEAGEEEEEEPEEGGAPASAATEDAPSEAKAAEPAEPAPATAATPEPATPEPAAPEPAAPEPAAVETAAPEPAAPETAATPEQPAAATPNPQALLAELTQLVRAGAEAMRQDASLRSPVTAAAQAAQAALKSGDYASAETAIATLRQVVGNAGAPAQPAPAAPPAAASEPASPQGPNPAKVQKIQKSRLAWQATLAKINRDMDQLVKTVNSAAADHELGATFESDFQSAVKPLLTDFDNSLSDLLSEAAKADDNEEHEKLLEQARAKLADYVKLAKSHPVIEHLDANPFMPVAVGKTLTATLAAVSAAIR